MNCKGTLLTFAICLSVAPALAGEIQATLIGESVRRDDVDLNMMSSGSVLTASQDKHNWSFKFGGNDPVAFHVDVNANMPDGKQRFVSKFWIPYYWDVPQPKTFPIPVVPAYRSIQDGRQFLRSVIRPKELNDKILVHQRAATIWNARLSEIQETGNINGIDVKIAYWVVFTARELMWQLYVEPDDATRSAAGWLQKVYDDPEKRKEFLTGDPADHQTIGKILEQLDGNQSYLYNAIIVMLDRSIAARHPDACRRVATLNAFFHSLDPNETEIYDRLYANTLVTKATKLECSHQALRARQEVAEADLEEMKADLVIAQDAVDSTRTENRFSAAIRRAERAIREAQNFLATR